MLSPSYVFKLENILYFIFLFRTFANHFQVEVHNLLVALGLSGTWKVGRKVEGYGDCGFDALLAQLEDPRIRATIDPILLRDITSIQGLYITFLHMHFIIIL